MIFMSAEWPKAPRRHARPWPHWVVGEHKLIAARDPDRNTPEETLMTWTTPAACDFRFGFEITMSVANR
jgi:pyrroloquinoline quinone biosynthesis protein A